MTSRYVRTVAETLEEASEAFIRLPATVRAAAAVSGTRAVLEANQGTRSDPFTAHNQIAVGNTIDADVVFTLPPGSILHYTDVQENNRAVAGILRADGVVDWSDATYWHLDNGKIRYNYCNIATGGDFPDPIYTPDGSVIRIVELA